MKHLNLISAFTSLFLFLFIYIIIDANEFSAGLLTLTLGVVAFNLFLFVVYLIKDKVKVIRKQFIRPVVFFLLGYLIVFFQAYIDLLLGNLESGDYFFFIKPSLINRASLLSSMGLLTLFIGYYSVIKKSKTRFVKHKVYPLKPLIWLFTLLNIISIYLNLDSYLYGEYNQASIEESAGSLGAYFQLLFYISYLAIIILHSINSRLIGEIGVWNFLKKLGVLFYLNVSIYLILVMISGDRDPILSIGLTFLCAMTLGTQVKLKTRVIVLGVVLGTILISFLGIVRKMDENSSFTEKVFEAYSKDDISGYDSFFVPTAELSTSVRTLHLAIDYVPNRHPYTYGIFQLRESLKAIPFAAGIFEPLFPTHFRFINSAFFITWIDKGEIYYVGTGSSIIADLYLSFGEIGIFICMFLLGRLFRVLDLYIYDRNIGNVSSVLIILSIVILGSSISWSRGTFLAPIKAFALVYILILGYRYVFTSFKKMF